MLNPIEKAVRTNRWKTARRLIRTALRKKPRDHWLITRLALMYYEEHAYSRALQYDKQAIELAPECPLVLWDYAGTLQMLGRHHDALRMYRRIIKRGLDSLAHGPCGEGPARARALLADCFYRQALSFDKLRQLQRAIDAIQTHLKMRGRGSRSIYSLGEVRQRLSIIMERKPAS